MIISRQNAKLKDIRRLRRCKGDRALLEGPHLLAEALAFGLDLDTVLVEPSFASDPEGSALVSRLARAPLEVAPELLVELGDADSPRGSLAVAHLPREGVETLPTSSDGVYLFLDGIQDPGNLGALARVAEAAGVRGLALAPGSVHPNHPRALRASAGSLLRLPTAVGAEATALAAHLASAADRPPFWLALVPRQGVDLYHLEASEELRQRPLILALGAEGPGLSPPLLERADLRLTIPLAAAVESLNVTVAAAIVLFELRRRRLIS